MDKEQILYFSKEQNFKVLQRNNNEVIELRNKDGFVHSKLYVNEPLRDQISLSYTVMSVAMKTKSNLILGIGGGTNIIQMKASNVINDIDAVDIDPKAFFVASEYFGLRNERGVHLICCDASEYVKKNDKIYDSIIIDIFKDRFLPDCVLDEEFFNNIYIISREVLIINTNISIENGVLEQTDGKSDLWKIIYLLKKSGFKSIFYNDEFFMGIIYAFKYELSIEEFRRQLQVKLDEQNSDINIRAALLGIILKTIDVSFIKIPSEQIVTKKANCCNLQKYMFSTYKRNMKLYKKLGVGNKEKSSLNINEILVKHRFKQWEKNGVIKYTNLGKDYGEEIVQWAERQKKLSLNHVAKYCCYNSNIDFSELKDIEVKNELGKIIKSYMIGYAYLSNDMPNEAFNYLSIPYEYFFIKNISKEK